MRTFEIVVNLGGPVITVRSGLSASLAALVVLLVVLDSTAGVGPLGWLTGITSGVVLGAAVARSASTRRVQVFGPADLVTLTRAMLSCAVAALVADSFVRDAAVGVLVPVAAIALVLDGVDGRVARSTGSASGFGARLDGEADAFWMLVLSVYVARSSGAWVLAIGAFRYLFAVGGWVLPWMRAQLPPRYWRKVVTATAGIALTFAAVGIGPQGAAYGALAVALALLTESFGRDVWWLWQRRAGETAEAPAPSTLGLPSP
jgi:phosphatidylglycerophosphate synthase